MYIYIYTNKIIRHINNTIISTGCNWYQKKHREITILRQNLIKNYTH